jgi:ATP-dependent RNA helicase DeaD
VRVAGQSLRISADSGSSAAAPASSPAAEAPAKRKRTEAAPSVNQAVEAALDSNEAPRKKKDAPKPRGKSRTYRVEVGRNQSATPSNLVGAIANEAGLEARHIGQIAIFDNYSLIELPEGMPREVLSHLQYVRVGGQPLHISEGGEMPAETRKPKSADKSKFGERGGKPFKDKKPGGDKPPRKRPKN